MKRSQLQELIKEMIQIIPEEKAKGTNGKACWDGYRYAGTKNGKDVCVKTGKGKTANESTNKPMSRNDLAPHYIAAAKAVGYSEEEAKKGFKLSDRFSGKTKKGVRVKLINYGSKTYEKLYRKLADILNKADGGGWQVLDKGSWYGDGSGWQVVKLYPFEDSSTSETTDKVSIDKLASGFPYKIEGGKAIIATWMPDESKENIIRKCKKAGYRCVPNNAGGVNIKLT